MNQTCILASLLLRTVGTPQIGQSRELRWSRVGFHELTVALLSLLLGCLKWDIVADLLRLRNPGILNFVSFALLICLRCRQVFGAPVTDAEFPSNGAHDTCAGINNLAVVTGISGPPSVVLPGLRFYPCVSGCRLLCLFRSLVRGVLVRQVR